MKFSTAMALLASAGAVQAVETIAVWVGMKADGTDGFVFSPDKITAPVDSVVQFQFMGGNHTVTQSTFDAPCMPSSTTNSSLTGFYSGFVPAMASLEAGEIAVFNVKINDTKPIWVYCSQGKHCQNGMSLVINENTESGKTLEAYKEAAKNVEQAGVPQHGDMPIGGSGTAVGTATATADVSVTDTPAADDVTTAADDAASTLVTLTTGTDTAAEATITDDSPLNQGQPSAAGVSAQASWTLLGAVALFGMAVL